jgi:aldehyde dehydrogenase (NAD+)
MNVQISPPAAKGVFINNRWRPGASGKTIPVVAPAEGLAFASIAAGDATDVDAAVKAARAAAEGGAWSRLSAIERGRLLSKLAVAIADHAEELAQLEARDTGKPLKQARNDMIATARYFEYYGGAADKVHGDTIPFLPGYFVTTEHVPYGVTAHIIPWNYPAQMFGRTVAPALAMGNACVVKPAEDACLTPLRLAELAAEIGLPEGAINIVPGLGEEAGAALSGHRDIDFISFTGSPEVGTLIQIAAARNHIGCTLELGGKSPHVVFDDADIDLAATTIAITMVQNAGQTCSAGSRVLIEKSAYDKVATALADRFSKLVAGTPEMDRDLGPVINATQKKRIETGDAYGQPSA